MVTAGVEAGAAAAGAAAAGGGGLRRRPAAVGIACTQRGRAAGVVGDKGDGTAGVEATEGRLIAVDVRAHRVTNR